AVGVVDDAVRSIEANANRRRGARDRIADGWLVHVHIERVSSIVDRLPIRVLLLIDEERVDRDSWLQHLDKVAYATRDVTGQDPRYAPVRFDRAQLVVIVAGGERSGPDEPGRAPLEQAGVTGEIEARVAHAA